MNSAVGRSAVECRRSVAKGKGIDIDYPIMKVSGIGHCARWFLKNISSIKIRSNLLFWEILF